MPEGWSWARLNQIFNFIDYRGSTPTKISSGVPLITAKNVKSGYIDYTVDDYISEDEYADRQQRGISCYGDILFTTEAPLGNAAIADLDKFSAGQRLITFQHYGNQKLNNTNFLYFLLSDFFQNQLNANKTGSTVAGIKAAILKGLFLPVPPIEEQQRIAASCKNMFNMIEIVKNEQEDISKLISITKSKILDLAIRGKLVPQDPNDEPASVLLDRIQSEKEELIKAGKIKRDKKESVIFKGEDNSYYADLPSGWCVSTLGNLTTSSCLNDGDWILSDNMVKFGNIKLIQLGSVGFMRYIDKSFKYLTDETFEELGCTEIHSGYLLINRIVSDKMSACILPKIEGKKITTVDTCWISPCDDWYNLKYILYAISSPQFQSSVMLNSSGTTRKRISKLNLISLPLAIPPLEEQKRIVNAIETAFK